MGQGLAVWHDFDAPAERPVVDAAAVHPTLLFAETEPPFGMAPVVSGEHRYTFGCVADWLSRPCLLARAPHERATERDAWRYWDGGEFVADWRDAVTLFDGAPIMTVGCGDAL